LFVTVCSLQQVSLVRAENIYQTSEEYINTAFSGAPPDTSKVWIKDELKIKIRKIMGHDLNVLRIRYWSKEGRTVWILAEIGKERPITTGITVFENRIEDLKVLIFRESRGWEVRYPFFTDQFNGLSLQKEKLSKSIDGISGATLSVNALTRMAKLALMLHAHSSNED